MIICIATAEITSPVRRISGPSMWVFVRKRLMLAEHTISRKFIKIAIASENVVARKPSATLVAIAAAIIPGPAIKGAARGTREISVIVF